MFCNIPNFSERPWSIWNVWQTTHDMTFRPILAIKWTFTVVNSTSNLPGYKLRFFYMYSNCNNEYKEVFLFLINFHFFENPIFQKVVYRANKISKFCCLNYFSFERLINDCKWVLMT